MYCSQCGAKLLDNAKYCIRCGASVPHRPEAAVARDVPAREPSGWPKLGLAFLAALFVLACEVAFVVVAMIADRFVPGIDLNLVSSVGGALGGLLSVVALGGMRTLGLRLDSIGLAVRKAWWVLLVCAALSVYNAVAIAQTETLFGDGWPLRAISTLALCAAIGCFEESVFRGLALWGILAVTGKDRRGVFVAALVSSVVFGMAHIDWTSLDYVDALSVAQAALKVVQTGMLGFYFCALVLRTGGILGSAVIHGLTDYLLLVPSVVLQGAELSTDYVIGGSEAVTVTVLYVVVILLYSPLVVSAVRMLSKVPVPERGAFMR